MGIHVYLMQVMRIITKQSVKMEACDLKFLELFPVSKDGEKNQKFTERGQSKTIQV